MKPNQLTVPNTCKTSRQSQPKLAERLDVMNMNEHERGGGVGGNSREITWRHVT